jgi:phytanoyl-CoA hydroxylase
MTPEELSHYHEHGYVVQQALFSKDEIQVWLDRLGALIRGEAPKSEGMLIMRDVMIAKGAVEAASPEAAIAKIQDFDSDPVLRTYTDHPKLLAEVASLTGENIVSIHNMLINKPPGVDGRHPLHQDLLYFPFRPVDRIVASWTAMEPIRRKNGCLVVVPGSHKGPLLPHGDMDWDYVNIAYYGALEVGAHPDRVHLEMETGDTVFFHPKLLHGSGRNRSSGFRRAISSHYAAAECAYPEGVDQGGARRYRLIQGKITKGGLLDNASAAAGGLNG